MTGLQIRAQVPKSLADLGWAAWLDDVLAGLRLDPGAKDHEVVIESTGDKPFWLTVNGRPAVVDLSDGRPSTSTSGAALPSAAMNEVAIRLMRRLCLLDDQPGPPDSVCHQLLDLGLPRPVNTSNGSTPRERQRELEAQISTFAPDSIVVEVPTKAARRHNPASLDAVVRLRESALVRYGVRWPDIRLRLTEGSDDILRIGLNQLWVRQRLSGEADWAEVVALLESVLDGRLHWFIRAEQIKSALDGMTFAIPDQVADCLAHYDTDTIAGCVRELVRQGDSVRNLARVIWLLLELGEWDTLPDRVVLAEQPTRAVVGKTQTVTFDTAVLASRIRSYKNEESWRAGIDTSLESPRRLSFGTEEQLVAAWDDGRELVSAELAVIEEYESLDRPGTVVVRAADAIRPVADVLQAWPRPPKVIAATELPTDADLNSIHGLDDS